MDNIAHTILHEHYNLNKTCVLEPSSPVRDSIPDWVIKAELAFPDLLKQGGLTLVIEGGVAPQQDEEHHSSTPQVHCRAVYQAWRALQNAHTASQLAVKAQGHCGPF